MREGCRTSPADNQWRKRTDEAKNTHRQNQSAVPEPGNNQNEIEMGECLEKIITPHPPPHQSRLLPPCPSRLSSLASMH